MIQDAAPAAMGDALWREWCDWARVQGVAIPADEGFARNRARVWEASEFVATTVARNPQGFAGLVAAGDLDRTYDDSEFAARLAAALHPVTDEPALHRALRLFRGGEMVRIIWRDITGLAPLAETLGDLSALADACIGQTLDWLHARACADARNPARPLRSRATADRARHGQAGCPRAQSQLRHRPDLRLSACR